MADRFVVCSDCSRHVKDHETACPFCCAPLGSAHPSTGEPFRRMSAAAAIAASVAAVGGCGTAPQVVVYYGSPGTIASDSGDDSPGDGSGDDSRSVVDAGILSPDALAPGNDGGDGG